ncbi:MAG: hypothetical protein LBU90_03655 [Bacteroidales bacterium]|jgi:hypothetical protein|nr:hypothetical protein [Bacteroidales bacterium]
METFLKIIGAFAIGVASMLCVFHVCTPKNTIETRTVTRIDTITVRDTCYVPAYRTLRMVDTIALATATDTERIIATYKQLRVYADTLRDSCFVVFLTDSVLANQIISRSWHGESYKRTTIITKEIQPLHRWRYGFGAGGLYSQSVFAPAVFASAENQRYMFFCIASTSIIGAGVSIRIW